MELGRGPPKRQEDLRGDEQHRQRDVQRAVAVEQAQPEDHRDEARPETGQELEGERGQEGYPECAQRRPAEPLAGLDHLSASVVHPSERSQGREPLDQFEQVGRQRRQASPLPCRGLGGPAPEEDHRRGHQRDQARQDEQRHPVRVGDPAEDGDRTERRQDQLGEVSAEVDAHRVDAPGRGEGELAGPFAGQPARPELERMGEQPASQGAPHHRRRPLGHPLADPAEGAPGGHGGAEPDQLGGDVSKGGPGAQAAFDDGGQEHRLDDHRDRLGEAGRDGDGQVAPGRRTGGAEAPVEPVGHASAHRGRSGGHAPRRYRRLGNPPDRGRAGRLGQRSPVPARRPRPNPVVLGPVVLGPVVLGPVGRPMVTRVVPS